MGRKNGKLINFLKDGLDRNLYLNLNYEDPNVFCVELPRFHKSKCFDIYAKILMAWFICNGRLHKYKSYSSAKLVFQTCLKKSDYLILLPSKGERLRFQFATSEEVKEKKKLLKEKMHPKDPPSVSSSGYYSEDADQLSEINNEQSDIIDDIVENPEKYLKTDENVVTSTLEDFLQQSCPKNDLQLEIQLDQTKDLEKSGEMKSHWQIFGKSTYDSIVLLTFKKQFVAANTIGIPEGDAYIPPEMLEQNVTFSLMNVAEFDEWLFLFFQKA